MDFLQENKAKTAVHSAEFWLPATPASAMDERQWTHRAGRSAPIYNLTHWDRYARHRLESFLLSTGLAWLRSVEDRVPGVQFNEYDVPHLAVHLVERIELVPRRRSYFYRSDAVVGRPGTASRAEAAAAEAAEHAGRKLPYDALTTAAERVSLWLIVGGPQPHRRITKEERAALDGWYRRPWGPRPTITSVPDADELAFHAEHGHFKPLFRTRAARAAESGRRSGITRQPDRTVLLSMEPGTTLAQQAALVGRTERTVRAWWHRLEAEGHVLAGDPRRPSPGGARCPRAADSTASR